MTRPEEMWKGEQCDEHRWVYVGDDLRCQRCNFEYPRPDPLIVMARLVLAMVVIVGVGVLVILWLRGGQ